jgi:GcrA cell cycle regulator
MQFQATWSAEKDDTLRKLWAEGLSASLIAERMGTTKNAIVGRARRLRLPSRPSPIRRNASPPPVRRVKPGVSTLPPVASAAPSPVPAATQVASPQPPGNTALAPTRPAAARPSPKPPRLVCETPRPPVAAPGDRGCQYITAFDSRRPARSTFCGAARSDVESSWCTRHLAIVFDLGAAARWRLTKVGVAA